MLVGFVGVTGVPEGAHIKRLRFGKEVPREEPGRRLLHAPWHTSQPSRLGYDPSDERRLFDLLDRRFDGLSRPVLNANTTVTVNFSISLHHIMDLVSFCY